MSHEFTAPTPETPKRRFMTPGVMAAIAIAGLAAGYLDKTPSSIIPPAAAATDVYPFCATATDTAERMAFGANKAGTLADTNALFAGKLNVVSMAEIDARAEMRLPVINAMIRNHQVKRTTSSEVCVSLSDPTSFTLNGVPSTK